jgi:type IV pilus assembly protein PilX
MNFQTHSINVSAHAGPLKQKQRGVALFIALIALVSMTIAGIALVRSVDTSNLIAGNLAFRQAALHVSDVGVENAFNALGTIALEANWPGGCTPGACNYYPTMQATDTKGVPTAIVWANVPSTTVNGSYNVKYVIDRLCSGPTPVTDIAGKCYADAVVGGGTKKAGGIVFSGAQAVYYRVTVRVEGPRNTTSMIQALLAR